MTLKVANSSALGGAVRAAQAVSNARFADLATRFSAPDPTSRVEPNPETRATYASLAKSFSEKLEELAQISGGEAYFPEDVSLLAADFNRILETLRRRYLISYTSTNSTRDGAWRKVEITSKKPGILVLSRGGYNAPEK